MTKNQFAAAEDAAAGAAAGADAALGKRGSGAATAADAAEKAEAKIKEEWLRAYLGALRGSSEPRAAGPAAPAKDPNGEAGERRPEAMATDDLVAEAMAGGDEEWEDVEDDWEDA